VAVKGDGDGGWGMRWRDEETAGSSHGSFVEGLNLITRVWVNAYNPDCSK
jgi:hypothetical protein